MKKAVTLKDIAKKTGYSVNTVSHALNNKPDISDSTKKIIRDAAEELGYIMNAAASSLRSGVSRFVAIIMPDIANPHFAVLIKELEWILNEKGYTLMILNTGDDSDREREALRTAIGNGVDGIIFCACQRDEENIRFLRDSGIPYVLLCRHFDAEQDSYVVPNNVLGGYLAARHLLELGHRKLLFINGPDCLSSARERLAGARQAVEEFGLQPEELVNATVEGTHQDVSREVQGVLKEHTDCTGVIAINDLIAIKAIFYLEQMGLTVPDDRSVVGFDNIQAGYLLPTGMTSVCSCREKTAKHLIRILLDQIEDKQPGERLMLDPHLVIQRTTKAVE